MPDPQSLEGKKALVTGGKRRIGRGIALSLAEAGCDVGVNDLEEDADAVETLRLIGERGAARRRSLPATSPTAPRSRACSPDSSRVSAASTSW